MSERACPNPECDKYQQPTRLMGGCECGSALQPLKPLQPTDEQLINLSEVLFGHASGYLLRASQKAGTFEQYRPGLLRVHARIQSDINAAR